MSTKKVFKNTLYYLIASFLPNLVGIVVLPLYTHYLSPDDFGIVALAQSFSMFLPLLMSLQLQWSVSRFFFEYEGTTFNKYLSTLTLTIITYSSITLFLLNYFLPEIISFVFPKTKIEFLPIFTISIITVFFNILLHLQQALVRVQQKAKLYMISSSVLFIVGIVISIILVVVLKQGAMGMVTATLISSIISVLSYTYINRKFYVFKFDLKLLIGPIKYSLPLIPHGLSSLIFMYSDRIILEKFVPLAVIGLYTFADRLAMVIKQFVNQVSEAYNPHFMEVASKDKAQAVKDTRTISEIAIFGFSFFFVIISLFSTELIYFFFDKKYFYSWQFLPLLASAYLFRGLYIFSISGLFYEKRTDLVSYITIISAAINIILNILLIPYFGVIVAALSTIVSFSLSYLLAIFFSRKIYPVRLNNKLNLTFIAYVFITILVSFIINSNFTVVSPYLSPIYYVVKLFLITLFILIGFYFKLLSVEKIKKLITLKK